MAILETEVWINLNGYNIKYYEEKGYVIPRKLGKGGKLRFLLGSKILVKVEDLPKSGVRVTKICDECGNHIPNQKYDQIILNRERTDGLDRCYDCSRILGSIKNRNNTPYERSLEYFAINNNKKYLLKEFSGRNIKNPNEISKSSPDVYWWNCPKCKSEYDMPVVTRTNGGSNCPYCAGQRVNHTNCLWSTHPEIAKLLKNPQRGYEISAGRGKREEFKCPTCSNVDKKIVANMVNDGFACSKCSDGISYPEKFMMNLLNQLDIKFETQKIFDWSKKIKCEIEKLNGDKRYDFFLPSLSTIIETHGRQHYEKGFDFESSKTLEEIQINDAIKEKLAVKQNNIDNYIIIDCKYSNLEYIKNSILNSELSDLFDLTNINWSKCHEFTITSLVKTACELWMDGINDIPKISKIMNIGVDTIRKYLKKGSEVNLCDYNPKERNGFLKEPKPVVQLSLEGNFIKEFPSMATIEKELNYHRSYISKCCSGKYRYAYGFKWIYKEDFVI